MMYYDMFFLETWYGNIILSMDSFFTYLKFRLRRGDVVPQAIHVWLSLWSVGTSEMGVIPSLPMVPSGKLT